MDDDQVRNELRAVIAEIAEVKEEEIGGDVKFIADLGMDSMLSLELLAGLEKKYKVKIPETKLAEMTTLNNVVAVLKGILP